MITLLRSNPNAHTTHATRCILNVLCRNAATPACTSLCGAYIGIHGTSGSGGRQGAALIPKQYRQVTLTNSPARDDQAAAYRIIGQYIKSFPRQFETDKLATDPIKSLYLYSESPGTGKTTTAVAILNEYLAIHYVGSVMRGLQPKQRPVFFLDVNAWQTYYNEFNRPGVPEDIAKVASTAYYVWFRRAQTADFAVLDDIGVRDASDAFRGDLHTVINHRITNGLPTVYTSNIALESLAEVYDERLYDRIRDLCVDIPFVGESKRGRREIRK